MIDRRELLEKTRERKLNLQIVEKDYVLGWLLFGLRKFDSLVFKGGTALSKIYFPETWRLSEDLDFVFRENEQIFPENIYTILKPYWERELGRLVNPLHDLDLVLKDLRNKIQFLQR